MGNHPTPPADQRLCLALSGSGAPHHAALRRRSLGGAPRPPLAHPTHGPLVWHLAIGVMPRLPSVRHPFPNPTGEQEVALLPIYDHARHLALPLVDFCPLAPIPSHSVLLLCHPHPIPSVLLLCLSSLMATERRKGMICGLHMSLAVKLNLGAMF
ncbi:hypothetical protein SORBI_3003G210701 [Sorghum bicolor]|uniref:Uncharacterized protein n=1 Tax=Sorghum bicolor TaxID=4558 RepID=A0A1W0VYC7_SORBI|nr:hypothetical protein SORBI_3003G210701 [Sorghum bicolor]